MTVASQNGFAGTVTLATFVSPGNSLSCTLGVTAIVLSGSNPFGSSTLSCSGSSGVYSVTVTGTSGSLSHATIVTYTVQDFSVSATPAAPVNAGVSTSSTVSVAAINGFSGTVSLSSSASPVGLTCSLSPATLVLTSSTTSASSTLSCIGSAGVYTVAVTGTLTGTSAILSRSSVLAITIQDFSINANPSPVSMIAGSQASSTISASGLNGFTGTVSFTSTVSSPLLACTISPTSISLPSSATSSLSCSGASGVYTVIVTGSSGSLTHPAIITFTVQDFAISGPGTVTAQSGVSSPSTLTVASQNGYTGVVSLTSTVSPSGGLVCSLTPTSVTLGNSGTSTLSCSGSVGTYTVSVSGTSSGLTRTTTVTYTVTDYSVTANPTSVSTVAGTTAPSTITVASINGFTGSLGLSASVSPSSGLTCSLTPTSLTL
ncbi:MAG TPA: hypothetical protein VE177_01525, partial [Candidatus Binatus sp.]|nr:hypothetical protein [Candidatus Binatus sp.]